MSTLEVKNIKKGYKTVDTDYVLNGCAKVWANFNGNGTIASRDSLNVSSLTDNGTGDYTISFTNGMANTNYAPVTDCSKGDSTNDSNNNSALHRQDNPFTTSSIRIACSTLSPSRDNQKYVILQVLGDLA